MSLSVSASDSDVELVRCDVGQPAFDSDVELTSIRVHSPAADILEIVKVHVESLLVTSLQQRTAILPVSRDFLDMFRHVGLSVDIIKLRARHAGAFSSFLSIGVGRLDKLPPWRAVWCQKSKDSDDPEKLLCQQLSPRLFRSLKWPRASRWNKLFQLCACRSTGMLWNTYKTSITALEASWHPPWHCLHCDTLLCSDCEMTIPCDSCGHTYCSECDELHDLLREVIPGSDKYYCRPCRATHTDRAR